MGNERDYRISNIRALAILVVVLGHSIIIFDTGWGYYTAKYQSEILQTLKHIINYFQMPLFFSISGYCFNFSAQKIKKNGYAEFVKSKAKRLLIPFIAISVLWMIPLRMISKYPNWQGKTLPTILWEIISGHDSGHLWYLGCLFWLFLIASALTIAEDKTNAAEIPVWVRMAAALLVLTVLSFVAPIVPKFFFFQDAAKYLIWFYLGYYLFSCMDAGKDKAIWLIIVSVAIMIAIGFSALKVTDGLYPTQFLKSNVAGALITGLVYLLMPCKTGKLAGVISDNSYGIYLFHSPLIYPVFCYLSWLKPAIVVTFTFGMMFPLALIITLALKRTKAGRVIIGEKW